jgi:hypothetical protein
LTLGDLLRKLGASGGYVTGVDTIRWGQLMREPAEFAALLDSAREAGLLVPLESVTTRLYGGVVTRANAYFLVRELEPDAIPRRFRVTVDDLKRVAVVVDGKETAHKIEREFLRRVIKGPEMLVGPARYEEGELRLFDVPVSATELRKLRAHGAEAYVKRGETEDYRASEDSLKGGVPAKRANIKTRKPYWHSLFVPQPKGSRLVIPEHFDERYACTLVQPGDDVVVVDKLFVCDFEDAATAMLTLAVVNSSLAWAQFELRGRTQLGQGVLEVKRADLAGVLVINPEKLSEAERNRLIESFAPLLVRPTLDAQAELGEADRLSFEREFYKILVPSGSERARLIVERAWRHASAERKERARSLDEVRTERGKLERTAYDIDAWAERVVTGLSPFPDPRDFVRPSTPLRPIDICQPVVGLLSVGNDLFTEGHVLAGQTLIAETDSYAASRFVRGALLRDRTMASVGVPTDDEVLAACVDRWSGAADAWRVQFDQRVTQVLVGIADLRIRHAIKERALQLASAI